MSVQDRIAGAQKACQVLARAMPDIVHAEIVSLKINALAERCRGGWRPVYPNKIDPISRSGLCDAHGPAST
jgi:hypothetical protein